MRNKLDKAKEVCETMELNDKRLKRPRNSKFDFHTTVNSFVVLLCNSAMYIANNYKIAIQTHLTARVADTRQNA